MAKFIRNSLIALIYFAAIAQISIQATATASVSVNVNSNASATGSAMAATTTAPSMASITNKPTDYKSSSYSADVLENGGNGYLIHY